MGLYSERIEALIEAALVDGELTDKERALLKKKAKEEGIDPDEFEMVLNARGFERKMIKQEAIVTRKDSVPSANILGTIGEKVTSTISGLFKSTEHEISEEKTEQDKEDKKFILVLIILIANGFLCYLLLRLV